MNNNPTDQGAQSARVFRVDTRETLKAPWVEGPRVSAFSPGEAMRKVPCPYFTLMRAVEVEPHKANAAEYVETSARATISEIAKLQALTGDGREQAAPQGEWEALGLVVEGGDPIEDQAAELLDALPLAVEATTTFEVVLGVGGPDRRLCFECDRANWDADADRSFPVEIRRVFYRYSWEGSAEVELHGEDKETAEAFGRRVVPELVE